LILKLSGWFIRPLPSIAANISHSSSDRWAGSQKAILKVKHVCQAIPLVRKS
jgi:hypothetical protein